MEKILIGVLKSSHKIKLKEALISKITESSQTPSLSFNLSEFVDDIEQQWHIGVNLNTDQLTYDVNLNYHAFLSHSDLITSCLKYIFAYQETVQSREEASAAFVLKSYQDLLTHLLNLVKLTFLPNLNRSNSLLVKQSVHILIVWLRCVCEAFLEKVSHTELCFNLVSLLAIVNSNLSFSSKNPSVSSMNYLYFMQNDATFGKEYVKLVRSIMLPLIEKNLNASTRYDAFLEKNFNQIYSYVENCLFETSCLLILSFCKEQTLNGDYLSEDHEENSAKNTLECIGESVHLIRYVITKSNSLFEMVFNFFIDILINKTNSSRSISMNDCARNATVNGGHVVELLKCFDLTRATFIIKNILEVVYSFIVDTKAFEKASGKKIDFSFLMIAEHLIDLPLSVNFMLKI